VQPGPNGQPPPGYTPRYDANGVLAGYVDPNGVLVGNIAGAVVNPDGTISYQNGNHSTFTTQPGGTSVSVGPTGLTTIRDASGNTSTTKADGTPASAADIQAANNAGGNPGKIFGSALGNGATGDIVDAVTGRTPGPYSPGSYLNPLNPPGIKIANEIINGKGPIGGAVGGAAGAAGNGVVDAGRQVVNTVRNTFGGDGGVGSANSGAISDAAAASKALADQYNAERSSYVNGGPVSLTPAEIAAYQAAVAPGPITSGVASGAGATGGHSVAAVAAPSVKAELAKYDTQYELAARANQEKLVQGLQGAIDGTDPSVAAIQLRQSTDRNVANQYALAASARGMDTGLAQRQAMLGAADLNSKAAADAAILRAQEITAARAQMADVLGTQRAGDLQVAGTTFNAEQGVNNDFAGAQNTRSNLNAQLENQTGIANAGNDTSASIASANNATNASIASANNLTSANINTAQIQSEIARANALNQLNRDTEQAKLTQNQGQFNVTQTLEQQKADQAARDALAKNALTASGQVITGTNDAAQVQAELAKAKAIKDAAIIGGVSAGTAALIPKLF
jgi:hypothetical protein